MANVEELKEGRPVMLRHRRVTFITTTVEVQSPEKPQQGRAPFGQTCPATEFCDSTVFVRRVFWPRYC